MHINSLKKTWISNNGIRPEWFFFVEKIVQIKCSKAVCYIIIEGWFEITNVFLLKTILNTVNLW